jgi:hypothetical protein
MLNKRFSSPPPTTLSPRPSTSTKRHSYINLSVSRPSTSPLVEDFLSSSSSTFQPRMNRHEKMRAYRAMSSGSPTPPSFTPYSLPRMPSNTSPHPSVSRVMSLNRAESSLSQLRLDEQVDRRYSVDAAFCSSPNGETGMLQPTEQTELNQSNQPSEIPPSTEVRLSGSFPYFPPRPPPSLSMYLSASTNITLTIFQHIFAHYFLSLLHPIHALFSRTTFAPLQKHPPPDDSGENVKSCLSLTETPCQTKLTTLVSFVINGSFVILAVGWVRWEVTVGLLGFWEGCIELSGLLVCGAIFPLVRERWTSGKRIDDMHTTRRKIESFM